MVEWNCIIDVIDLMLLQELLDEYLCCNNEILGEYVMCICRIYECQERCDECCEEWKEYWSKIFFGKKGDDG